MTALLLVLASLVLLATMFYLTVSVNEFEKKVKDLDAILKKRYRIQTHAKSSEQKAA